LFGAPFRELITSGLGMALDGEIAVLDDRGVTHIGGMQDAIFGHRPELLAYFAFDLLHLDGYDLRGCPIEDRKALVRGTLDRAGCPGIVYVDRVTGQGAVYRRGFLFPLTGAS
jgi:bifunctional non-homologous end joining protein LigD